MILRNTQVYNFENAFHGMRNPMNSWDKSDSFFGIVNYYNDAIISDAIDAWVDDINAERVERGFDPYSLDGENYSAYEDYVEKITNWYVDNSILKMDDTHEIYDIALLGPNDLRLAQRLVKAGGEHGKFMRQIFTTTDITAPLYWWKEMDTYKVGTTANSTSTMHKLVSKPITIDDFSFDNDLKNLIITESVYRDNTFEMHEAIESIVFYCEKLRMKFIESGNIKYWRALIQLLPESYNQTRTWTANYAILRNIYFQRKNHKLKEWNSFCEWIKALPYAEDLITIGE